MDSTQCLRGQGARSCAADRGVIWAAYKQIQGYGLGEEKKQQEKKDEEAEPGELPAEGKAKNEGRLSVEKSDSFQFKSVHCLKKVIHCLKWWIQGEKNQENE